MNEKVAHYMFMKIIRKSNGEDIKFDKDEKEWMTQFSEQYGL